MTAPTQPTDPHRFDADFFTGWAIWARKYGSKVIQIEPGPEPNTLLVRVHPEGFPEEDRDIVQRAFMRGPERP